MGQGHGRAVQRELEAQMRAAVRSGAWQEQVLPLLRKHASVDWCLVEVDMAEMKGQESTAAAEGRAMPLLEAAVAAGEREIARTLVGRRSIVHAVAQRTVGFGWWRLRRVSRRERERVVGKEAGGGEQAVRGLTLLTLSAAGRRRATRRRGRCWRRCSHGKTADLAREGDGGGGRLWAAGPAD